MKRFPVLIGVLAGAALAAGGAVAQTPTFDWTGGYVGVQGGYVEGKMPVRFRSPPAPESWRGEPKPSGGIAGIYGGYNWQAGTPFVWGIEGEVNWSGTSDRDRETLNGVTTG